MRTADQIADEEDFTAWMRNAMFYMPAPDAMCRDIADKVQAFIASPDPLTRVHPLRRFWWKWQDRISTAWDVLRGRHECGGW